MAHSSRAYDGGARTQLRWSIEGSRATTTISSRSCWIKFAALIPLGRLGRPEEIARTALFLATEDSSFVSRAELFADGGMAQA